MGRARVGGIIALMLVGFLAGCSCGCPTVIGESPDPVDPADPDDPEEPGYPDEQEDELADMLRDADLMGDRLDALSVTSETAMPQSGSATYSGYGTLLLKTPGGETSLFGEATLTANFDEASISGRVDDFLSGTNDANAEELDGRLRIRGDLTSNGFDAEIEGSIESNALEIEIEGTGSGDFLGSHGAAMGLEADEGSLTFMVNGESVPGSLVVVAED